MQNLNSIDWTTWQAKDPATLVFVIRNSQILLIRKKRGLGKGKINGPGGRLEPGETFIECAAREVQEELGVTPIGLEECGELKFQFTDGYSIHVHVFRGVDIDGEPIETDEAIPHWTPLDSIPYDEMWEDDRIWLPLLIAGDRFYGRFLFDGEKMLDYEMEEVLE